MEATFIVTFLVLAQYTLFGIQTAQTRGKHGLSAPAQTGHPEYERMNRVHLNTEEQLVMFLPALWTYAYFVNPTYSVVFGLVFIIGRFVYRSAYLKDPQSRSVGFALTFIPTATMLIWTLVVVVRRLL